MTVNPFTIQCESCGSRIKVRKQSAIGRVLPCPKCQHPVKIVAPSKAKSTSAADAKGAPPTSSSLAEIATPQNEEESSEDMFGGDFAEVDSILQNYSEGHEETPQQTPSTQVASKVASIPSTEEGPAATSDQADSETAQSPSPALPNNEWISESTRSRQRLLLTISLSIAGILVASIAVAYFVIEFTRSDPQQVTENDPASPNEDSSNDRLAEDDQSSGDSDETDSSKQDPTNDATGSVDNATATSTGDETETNDADTNDSGSNDAGDEEVLANDGTGASTDANDSAEEQTAELPSTDASDEALTGDETEPPGFNIRRTDEEVAGALNSPILSGLDDFDDLVIDTGLNDARAAAAAQRRTDSWSLADANAPYVELPRMREIDIPAQLEQPIIQLDHRGTTLFAFLDFMSQLIGAPVALSGDVVEATEVDPNAEIDVSAANQTIDQVLQSNLSKLGLNYRIQAHSIEVIPAEFLNAAVEVSYPIGDLLAHSPKGFEEISALLQTLIEPSTWEANEGPGHMIKQGDDLLVTQSPEVQLEVKRFLELLTALRTTNETGSVPDLQSLQPYGQAQECLNEPLKIQIYQPRPLGDVVRRLNKQAEIDVLIDWESLFVEGWTMDTELPLIIDEGTVESAIRRLGASLELSYQVLGPRQFLILSRPQAAQRKQVAFFDLGPLLDAGIKVEQLAVQVQVLFPQPQGSSYEQFYYDTESRFLFARLTQEEQRALSKFLTSWERTASGSVR